MTQQDETADDRTVSVDRSLGRLQNLAAALFWSAGAGVCFACIRFLASWLIIWWLVIPNQDDPSMRQMKDLSKTMAWTAAVSAGLAGTLLWPFLVARHPSRRRGAIAGLLAAWCSYLGIALFGAGWGLAENGEAATALFGALFCGFGSIFFTGLIVFPALAVAGMVLGRLHASTISAQSGGQRP